ncbi:hypothetical protein ACU5AX_15830 [Sphingomonas sp. XXL09]|uniref:hypothetical protein n=1 Tax=Sphingomonas sp. XXL09 TaxID=3457787 RepID=UPI00406BCC3F
MADTFSDGLWAFVVIGGFIILGLAIAFAKLRNRSSPEAKRRTEDATADLYAREEAERRRS